MEYSYKTDQNLKLEIENKNRNGKLFWQELNVYEKDNHHTDKINEYTQKLYSPNNAPFKKRK